MKHAILSVALLALTACDGGGACTFNSECAAGSFCDRALGTCRSECSAEEPCPGGEACTSFGMCVGVDAGAPDAGIDAGAPRDGGAPPRDGGTDASAPRDAGTDAFDPRPACVIAGGTDGDGDGYCPASAAEPDCDDARAEASPAGTEVCTAQTALRADRAIDEDCDGAIDEGCPWHFGRPHAVELGAFDRSGLDLWSPRLSGDGLRLYLPGRPLFVMARAAHDQPFGAPEAVATTDPDPPLAQHVEISRDELEVFIQGFRAGGTTASDILRATRTSRTAPFGTFERVTEASSDVLDLHPALRPDGRELLFLNEVTGGFETRRMTRASVGGAWSAAEAITVDGVGGVAGPGLSEDGLTLVYYAGVTGGYALRLARRASLASTEFTGATDLPSLAEVGALTSHAAIYERDAEIYFVSDRAFTQPLVGGRGVWRARICRDGPCPEQPIACPSTVRSEDWQHCYTALATSDYAGAVSGCEATGARVVEIGSQAEQDLVWSTFGGSVGVWIGLEQTATADVFAWASGAPLVFTNWWPSEPNPGAGEPHAQMYASGSGFWIDVNGPDWLGVPVCETQTWPTW